MTESVNQWQIGYWLCLDSNIAPGDEWLLFNLVLKVKTSVGKAIMRNTGKFHVSLHLFWTFQIHLLNISVV